MTDAVLFQPLIDSVRRVLGAIATQQESADMPCFVVRVRDFQDAVRKLRDDPDTSLTQLTDICGADYPMRRPRFEVVYHFLSMRKNWRVRLKVCVSEHENVPSLCSLFSSANWLERETWDMFGISFEGHPNLSRLLTDYEFEGHPLRKDFPVFGKVELRYDAEEKKLVYRPVNLEKDNRLYSFETSWQGCPVKGGKP